MRSTARCLAAASCVAVLLPWHGHGAEPAQPSLTKFGPCFKIDGSVELVWMRSFLGPTGAIGWFHGSEIVIREVTPGSPAEGLLKEGDVIIAADGHELGPDPRVGMGCAVGDAQARDGKLSLTVYRDGGFVPVVVPLPALGATPATWPLDGGGKSEKIHRQFCDYLVATQSTAGEFSERPASSTSGLILLANPDPRYLEAARRLAYCYVRHPSGMDGMGSWSCGYTAIYLAEYYMVTGDRTVLPELDRLCREIAKGQAPSGTWGHSAGYSRSYAVGGMVNMCGITNWLGMIMGGLAGVPVDQKALDKATAFFGRFTDRSSTPYGDHEPFVGGRGNGKDAVAAVAFDLLGERVKARQWGRYVTDWYSDWEGGHTGSFFSYFWNPLGGLRTPEQKDYLSMMEKRAWFFDMARSWDGAGLLNDGVDYNGRGPQFCTPAVAVPFAISEGRKRLAVMGAPVSPFRPGKYPELIEQARQLHFERKWDEVEKLLSGRKLAPAEAAAAAWLVAAAAAARASLELTITAVHKNLDEEWDPDLAKRQLEDLQLLLGTDDPRITALLARAVDPANFKTYRAAEQVYTRNQWLTPMDDTARDTMKKLAGDPSVGRFQQLAREQLDDRLGSFRFLYQIGGLFYQNGDSNKWDNGRSREFKLYQRVADAYGGAWPQWVAKETLRKVGMMCPDRDTIKGWTALVPVSAGSERPVTARLLFQPADGFDHGPDGWTMPGFDDSGWQQGDFPVGFNTDEKVLRTKLPTDKRAFCARIRFQLGDTDFDRLRVLFRFRHFANVYLNGSMITRVLWEGNHGGYGDFHETMELKDNAVGLLKKGENVLAIEGVWNMWWGIFDAGLYGHKHAGAGAAKPAATPPPVASAAPPVACSERFRPVDALAAAKQRLTFLATSDVARQLSDEWLATRDFAARELAARGGKAMPAIIASLKESDWRARSSACQAINYLGDAAPQQAMDAVDPLVTLLDDKDPFVRYWAGMALVRIGKIPATAVPRIRTMLVDQTSWWPRRAGFEMLNRLQSADIDTAWIKGMTAIYATEPNFVVEEGVGKLLAKWAGQLPGDEVVKQAAAALTSKEVRWDGQARLLGLLGGLGTKARPATPAVEKLLAESVANQEHAKVIKETLDKINHQ